MRQNWRTTRPSASEHAPFYAGYIAAVPDGDLLETLEGQLSETLQLWREVPPAKADYAYAEGKWTVKAVMSHIIDAERVFSYRALRAARGDATPVPGFDENAYAKEAPTANRTVRDLADEFEHVRRGNIMMYRSLDDQAAGRSLVASNNPVTARALMWITAGHERHHSRVLRERYLGG